MKIRLKGQSLIELLLTMGIAALLIPALATSFISSRSAKPQQIQRTQAVALLKQTVSAVKNVRDQNWTTFAVNGKYHPVLVSSQWALASGTATVSGMTQQVVISDVFRDTTGTIVTSGGILDPSTKQVTITISWTQPYQTIITAVMYLTRTGNFTYKETTTTDFNKGTTTNAAVISTVPSQAPNDGQVQLGAGGGGDWCSPGASVLTTFALPGSGVPTSISATAGATQNFAYATNGNNHSGDAIDSLTISHGSPPTVTNPAANNEAKAYGVFVDPYNNYVYFNENYPPYHTVRIVQGTTLVDVGYFDASVKSTGTSVYVLGNTGYTTVGNTLYSFDVSTINGSSSQTQKGSVTLSGNGKRVFVVGTNAYVATDNTTNQLQIIDVSNPSNMSVTKSINLGNNLSGVDLYINSSQTYAYIVTTYLSGKNDFFIVDLNNTNNIYGYQTVNGMNPNGVAIVTGNRAILVGTGGEEYEVFNITTPSNATHCGGMTPSGTTTIYAVAPILQSDGKAFSYILTDNAAGAFQIVLGGSGGQFSSSGVFESQTFDPYSLDGITTSRSFNRLVASVAQPSSTTIQMQVAVAQPISGSCNGVSFTYEGPNASSSAYFTPSSGIISALIPMGSYSPNYQNPGRCFRYKAWFNSTDPSQTPILFDTTVNYSP